MWDDSKLSAIANVHTEIKSNCFLRYFYDKQDLRNWHRAIAN
ncbi:MAG: hypothetical protein V7L22_17920 [Nostoc sp.]|nr:hypothetical protein [Nostoc sp. C052]